jgi:hypothetical protein
MRMGTRIGLEDGSKQVWCRTCLSRNETARGGFGTIKRVRPNPVVGLRGLLRRTASYTGHIGHIGLILGCVAAEGG